METGSGVNNRGSPKKRKGRPFHLPAVCIRPVQVVS